MQGFIKGAYAAAIGTILGACVLLGKIAIGDWLTALVALVSLGVLFRWKVSNPALVAVTAVIGLIAFPLLKPTWVFVKYGGLAMEGRVVREAGRQVGLEEESMGSAGTVVFVCLHGSAKSLIAAEHLRRLARQRGVGVEAISMGVEPDPQIPSKVVEGLLGDGIDVRGRRPRAVTGEALAAACHVVSFGCDLGDMLRPGLAVERWDDVPPVSADFRVARDAIVARLPRVLATCGSQQRSPA